MVLLKRKKIGFARASQTVGPNTEKATEKNSANWTWSAGVVAPLRSQILPLLLAKSSGDCHSSGLSNNCHYQHLIPLSEESCKTFSAPVSESLKTKLQLPPNSAPFLLRLPQQDEIASPASDALTSRNMRNSYRETSPPEAALRTLRNTYLPVIASFCVIESVTWFA